MRVRLCKCPEAVIFFVLLKKMLQQKDTLNEMEELKFGKRFCVFSQKQKKIWKTIAMTIV